MKFKACTKVNTVLFCLVLACVLPVMIASPAKSYSATEKRRLTAFPTFSISGLISGEYGKTVEKYLADQFPLRNSWVSAYSVLQRLTGKTDFNGVYFASDGYLIEKHSTIDFSQGYENVASLAALAEKADGIGVPLYFMPVPTASVILTNRMPANAAEADQQALTKYAAACGLHTVDLTETLTQHQSEYIYCKTDHHWTLYGAYYAYAAWMSEKSTAVEALDEARCRILCDDFRGTTYAKVNDPFSVYDTLLAYDSAGVHHTVYNGGTSEADGVLNEAALSSLDRYAVYANGNQVVSVTTGDGDGKLLIIKDSYANCFLQFVLEDYGEIHMIDLRFFRDSVWEYIQQNGITEILVLYNIPNFCSDQYVVRCAS